MSRVSGLYRRILLSGTCLAMIIVLAGCSEQNYCLFPGCDKVAIGETGGCYEHGKRKTSSNYKRTTYQGSENTSKKDNISETKKVSGPMAGLLQGINQIMIP